VVVFHAFQWLDDQFWIGAAGVDLFFVISGFIIWTVSAGRESQPASFVWRRFTRVAPAYWVMTGLVAVVALADPAFLPQVAVTPRHLALSLAFIQHADPYGRAFPLLPPGWTLNYEAVFYLIVAAALLAPQMVRLGLVIAALAAIAALGFLDPPLYGMGANLMMLEFAAGAWLGHRFLEGRRAPAAAGLALAGLGLLALAGLYVGGVHGGFWRELVRPILWGAPATMIVAGAVIAEQGGRLRVPRALVRLGDASYAIYLCHMPATALIAHTLGVRPAALFVPIAATASIAAGFGFHFALEKPLIAACRSWPGRLAALRPARSEAAP
jgi:exopolysaccharide production protein ExoZ